MAEAAANSYGHQPGEALCSGAARTDLEKRATAECSSFKGKRMFYSRQGTERSRGLPVYNLELFGEELDRMAEA